MERWSPQGKVRQRQATLDEDAFSGESKVSAEDLVDEEPLDAEEDEKNDGEEEDEEDEGDSDSGNDDDNDTSKSEASGDEDSSGGNNVVVSKAEEAEEEEESDRGYVREHGSDGDTRRGSHSEVDSPLQIRRTKRRRGSREPVHRGVLVQGKDKGTMADGQRSLFGRGVHQPCGRSTSCSSNKPPKGRPSTYCGKHCYYCTW